MEVFNVPFSQHAARRMAQRNLTAEDVSLVLQLGHVEYRTGVEFYFFGSRDVSEGMERELDRLVGVTVVVSNGEIITAYRNRHALSGIKRKLKHRIPARLITSKGMVSQIELSESQK
jgi:hypothetical protein